LLLSPTPTYILPLPEGGEDLERNPSFTNASSYGNLSARGGRFGEESLPILSLPLEGEEKGGEGLFFISLLN